MSGRRRLRLAAIVVCLAAFAGLSHYSNTSAKSPVLGVVLALGPLLAVAHLLMWRWGRFWALIPAAVAAGLLLRLYWPLLERDFPVVFLLQEGGFYSLMAASFGRSLFGHRTALCTQLADQLHGPLNAQELRYTRRVTAAWALFFLSIAAATLGFFLLAPLRIWSLFANFGVLPLTGLMFVAEYAIRLRVLPQVRRPGILAAVRVYFAASH
jgi:uncharacterized membrane protein